MRTQMSTDKLSNPSRRPKRNGPGRPEGHTENREKILDTAEKSFATHGYAAASGREIASAANVTQSMVNYYFGSKRQMFREVYLRRGGRLAAERMKLLDRITSRGQFDIEDVVRAYLIPPFRLQATAQGRYFLRLQARLHAEPDELAFELRREVYDRPVRAYVGALQKLLPHKSEETLYLRFAQLIGIYLYILSDAHRIQEISGGKCSMPQSDSMIEEIVVFTCAGLRS